MHVTNVAKQIEQKLEFVSQFFYYFALKLYSTADIHTKLIILVLTEFN